MGNYSEAANDAFSDPQLRDSILARLCIIAFVCFTSIQVHAVLLVVPNGSAEVLGAAASSAPFGFDLELCRVQQAYDSSQFSLLGTNGGYINKLLFRLGLSPGYFRPPSGVIHMPLTINLSTTTNSLNKLSTVFDQNTGTDKTTVYSATYNLNSLTGCGVVEPFGVVIPLSPPFFYNPTNGPLLVEMVAGNHNLGVGICDYFSLRWKDATKFKFSFLGLHFQIFCRPQKL